MRMLPVATLALAALLLSGCVPETPPVTPTPSPSSTPVFASEEEALAAAEAAYAEYVKIADQVFVDGGADAERLASVATGSQLSTELAGFKDVSAKGLRSTGGTTFDDVELQQLSNEGTTDVVSVYLCEDISAVNVFDASGVSVVSANRPNRVRYEVTFDYSEDKGGLLVSLKEPWEQKC